MPDVARQFTQLEADFDESTSQPIVAAQVGVQIVVDEVIFTNNGAAAATLTLESTPPPTS